jgi:hypothetical protein
MLKPAKQTLDEDSSKALRERILRERAAEVELRRQTASRIRKFQNAAEELKTLADVGITEELLRRRQSLSRSSSASGGGSIASSARGQRAASAAASSATSESVSSSRRRQGPALAGASADVNDDSDALSEDHVVVISANAQAALLQTASAAGPTSSTYVCEKVPQVDARSSPPSVGFSARQQPAEQCGAEPPLPDAGHSPPSSAIIAGDHPPRRSISAPNKKHGALQHRTSSSASDAAAGVPRSILKRFPLRRRHGRRVHFSETDDQVILLHSSLTSSSKLETALDAENKVSVLLRSSAEEVFFAALREQNQPSSQQPPGWGADSDVFAKEWDLKPQKQQQQQLPVGSRLARPPKILIHRTSSPQPSTGLLSPRNASAATRLPVDPPGRGTDLNPRDGPMEVGSSRAHTGGVVVPTGAPCVAINKNAGIVQKCAPHTKVSEGVKVVLAPDVGDILSGAVVGVLPQRKSEHASLSRRDRFGRKVGLVPQ